MDDVLDEGESSQLDPGNKNSSVIQHVIPLRQTPQTPSQNTKIFLVLETPQTTRVQPPLGYYKALNEGEKTSVVVEHVPGETGTDIHEVIASAHQELTLKEALSGPDAKEW